MNIGKLIAGIAGAAVVAEGAYAVAASNKSLLRPPGSQGEADFMARCVKCGLCVEACPYGSIFVADMLDGAAAGTPCIDAVTQACRMCEDFPCVKACPTEALRGVESRADVNMGFAVIDTDACIAYKGLRCEVCYRVCPLIDQAIYCDPALLQGDGIHVSFQPTINEEICTGCGLCVERCVVHRPKLAIRIKSIAEQEKKR